MIEWLKVPACACLHPCRQTYRCKSHNPRRLTHLGGTQHWFWNMKLDVNKQYNFSSRTTGTRKELPWWPLTGRRPAETLALSSSAGWDLDRGQGVPPLDAADSVTHRKGFSGRQALFYSSCWTGIASERRCPRPCPPSLQTRTTSCFQAQVRSDSWDFSPGCFSCFVVTWHNSNNLALQLPFEQNLIYGS